MKLVNANKNVVLLDTGLNESAFSKSAHGLNFLENGMLVQFNLMENNFQFTPWAFLGTTVLENSSEPNNANVFFEGEGFEGQSLLSIINTTSDENIAIKNRALFAFIKTISRAIESKITLPINGAGGILYHEKPSKKNPQIIHIQLLFLPEQLFEFCISHTDEKTYAQNQGIWQNKSLTQNNSLLFTQTVALYYSLSNIFPFMKNNTQQRQEDIIDSNFIQINNIVNGINDTLAANINMGLCIDNQYQREKSLFLLDDIQVELGLTDDGNYKKVERKSALSNTKFEHKSKNQQKSKSIQIKIKRIFKYYSVPIIIALAVIAFASNFAYKNYSENLLKQTAKGLDSFHVVELFYSGFHQQDSTLMQLVAKGRQTKAVVDMISNVYVTGAARNAYEGTNSTLSPEVFLMRPELMNNWIFGITNFKIDNNDAYNRFESHKKIDYNKLKKIPCLPIIQNGTQEKHTATYNLVYSSGYKTPITVDSCKADIICTYNKDQWYITSIVIEHNQTEYDQDVFKNDYAKCWQDVKNPKDTVELLRQKYDWLPDKRAMNDAEKIADYQKNYFK